MNQTVKFCVTLFNILCFVNMKSNLYSSFVKLGYNYLNRYLLFHQLAQKTKFHPQNTTAQFPVLLISFLLAWIIPQKYAASWTYKHDPVKKCAARADIYRNQVSSNDFQLLWFYHESYLVFSLSHTFRSLNHSAHNYILQFHYCGETERNLSVYIYASRHWACRLRPWSHARLFCIKFWWNKIKTQL